MSSRTDQDLIDRWRGEPAPLLPILQAFHDRDGYLSNQALEVTSSALKIPLAELFATVTFYHHFARTPGGKNAPRVCMGPVCCSRGGPELLTALEKEGATPMACPGRCDDPVPVLIGDKIFIGDASGQLSETPPHLPPPNPEHREECVFAFIRETDQASLGGYRASGGYEGLERAVKTMQPDDVIQLLDDSGLDGPWRGRFPHWP